MYKEEAMKILKDFHDKSALFSIRTALETLHPELAESEDERIRKAIICGMNALKEQHKETFASIPINDCITWLEKQSEQKPTLPKWKYKKDHTPLLRDSIILNKYGCVAKSPSGAIISDTWVLDYDELVKLPKEELERQGEQKPQGKSAPESVKEEKVDNVDKNISEFKAKDWYVSKVDGKIHNIYHSDKVETKFKIGDWVVFNNNHESIYKIEKIENFQYTLRHTLGGSMPLSFSYEDMIRLWTIEDAKPGDVLCGFPYADFPWIGIFHELNDDHTFNSYCYLQAGVNGKFCPPSGENIFGKRNVDSHSSKSIVPATKEQRNLLFQKMHEADYKWDSEKKELEKIKH